MALACYFEELDEVTRNYLHDVRTRRGRGTPGIFAPVANNRPMLALFVGPIIAIVMFVISLSSSKDPWAIALLQTAAVLIGGWSVVYAFRRWMAGRSRIYGGYYTYFDPLFIYQVEGERVRITSLKTVQGVEALGGNRVAFDLGGSERGTVVTVSSAKLAQDVEDFYSAMDILERKHADVWGDVEASEIGAASKYFAEEEEVPRDRAVLDLTVTEVPRDPQRSQRAGFGWFPLILIVGFGVGLFLAFRVINVPLHDDIAWNQAKSDGAPGLRGYLLDDRNVRHRDEAKTLLAAAYDPAIQKLKTTTAAEDPKLREGMIALLEMLKTSDSPVLSIEIRGGPEDGTALRLRQELADGIARGIDPRLIAFVSAPDDKPANIEVKFPAEAFPDKDGTVTLTVEIRTKIEEGPVATGKIKCPLNQAPGISLADQLKVSITRELVGGWSSAPPIDLGGGDFD